MNSDAFYIRHCLSLASYGRGKVGNGALVGSVLVRNDSVIAKGWHEAFGKVHAERMLLQKFDQQISSSDILYVNLEPCCHTGKTPPCTDIILERGIKNVVFGMHDPDPRVAGKGIEALKCAGVNVIGPILPQECARFNRGFVSVRTKGRPWITLKQAIATDGSFANPDGSPKKITSDCQNAWSHTFLRARHDAILVGVGTVIADNPKLDCRLSERSNMNNIIDQYQPWRIILDPHLRIPIDARLITNDRRSRTMILHCSQSPDVDQSKAENIRSSGVRVVSVDMRDGRFDWDHLWRVLTTPEEISLEAGSISSSRSRDVASRSATRCPPAARLPDRQGRAGRCCGDRGVRESGSFGLTSMLVEGGKRTWELFRNARMVDEEVILAGK